MRFRRTTRRQVEEITKIAGENQQNKEIRRQIEEIDGVVPAQQSRCKHVWAPLPAGDGHGTK